MNELALFAGAGGGLLGSRLLGWRTVCYVEWNKFCVEVLKARIRDGMLDDAPIWDDVGTFDGRPWAGRVDIITAGFPCQPFSGAGKQLGERDKRNRWPDTLRIIREARPRFVLLENVARLLSNAYIGRIFGDLAESGYDARWDCIPASAVGANHQRDRLWIVADANGRGFEERAQLDGESKDNPADRRTSGGHVGGCGGQVSDAKYDQVLHDEQHDIKDTNATWVGWWKVEPELGRVADGVAHRLDRLAALGNGQVPAVARAAWMLLSSTRATLSISYVGQPYRQLR